MPNAVDKKLISHLKETWQRHIKHVQVKNVGGKLQPDVKKSYNGNLIRLAPNLVIYRWSLGPLGCVYWLVIPSRVKRLSRLKDSKVESQCNQGSDDNPVYITSAPGFETWNSSRDPSETNLAWVEILPMVQFCAIDHALFWRFCDFKMEITRLLIRVRSSAWL